MTILVYILFGLAVILLLAAWLPRLLLKAFLSVEDLYSTAFDFMEVLYDLDPEQSRRRWLNYGLWFENTRTYEEACDNLASRLCEEGEFTNTDRILDVGCGFGTSSFFWYDEVKRKTGKGPWITGLNISRHHIEKAKADKLAWNYPGEVGFEVGDAVKLGEFRSKGITKVVALECAFHFRTRERFFQEAWSVLQPGGKIVLADIIMKKGTPTYLKLKRYVPSFLIRPFFSFLSEVGQVPLENQVEVDEYLEQLRNAGFRNIRCEGVMPLAAGSIRHYRKKAEAILAGDVPPWLRSMDLKAFRKANRIMGFVNYTLGYADYIIVSAEK